MTSADDVKPLTSPAARQSKMLRIMAVLAIVVFTALLVNRSAVVTQPFSKFSKYQQTDLMASSSSSPSPEPTSASTVIIEQLQKSSSASTAIIEQLQKSILELQAQAKLHAERSETASKQLTALETRTHAINESVSGMGVAVEAASAFDDAMRDVLEASSYPFLFDGVFVISLREERWQRYSDQLSDWPELMRISHHVAATHGAYINESDWQRKHWLAPDYHNWSRSMDGTGSYVHKMTAGELGCADTHYRAWKQCVALDLEFCAFAEDDVNLNRTKHEAMMLSLPGRLNEGELKKKFEILYLAWSFGSTKPSTGSSTLHVPDGIDFTVLNFYILSRTGAAKLIEHFHPVNMPVDCYVAQHVIGNRGKQMLYGLMHNPSVLDTGSFSSDTQGIQ